MKVVFLDIDGVLNSNEWFKRHPTPGKWALDRTCVQRINIICEKAKADVVISSSWRLHMKPQYLIEILVSHGLTASVIGLTPRLFYGLKEADRGDEIGTWLDKFGQEGNIEKFVILDDYDDMNIYSPYLVQTSPEVGITDIDVKLAISILT